MRMKQKTREQELKKSMKKDLKLAKEVNWLYARLTKKEMGILMKWVSANCDVVKEQERKRVLEVFAYSCKKLYLMFKEALFIPEMIEIGEKIDELLLVYAAISNINFNKAEKEIRQKIKEGVG